MAAHFLGMPLNARALTIMDVGAEAEGASIHRLSSLRAWGKIRALTAWLQEFVPRRGA